MEAEFTHYRPQYHVEVNGNFTLQPSLPLPTMEDPPQSGVS
jgi:hypothetical protein